MGVVLFVSLLAAVVLTSVVMGVLTTLWNLIPTLVSVAVFLAIFAICYFLFSIVYFFTGNREPRDKDEG